MMFIGGEGAKMLHKIAQMLRFFVEFWKANNIFVNKTEIIDFLIGNGRL